MTRTVERGERVTDLDEPLRWPDGMVGSARQRQSHFAVTEVKDPHQLAYLTFESASPPADSPAAPPQPSPTSGTPEDGPQPVRAQAHPMGGSEALPPGSHPLAYAAGTLDKLQSAIEARSPGRFVAAEPDASFATLTTGTHGAPRVWGANILEGPRLLSAVAGVPRQNAEAVFAQFPQLTLPTAQPLSAEGVALVEYASSAAGSVTLGRFGRWTDMSKESLIGANAGAVTAMHRVGIALDLDKVLIDAIDAAAGAAVAFDADVPAAIRRAIARVLANTAQGDPRALVAITNPDDADLLQDVAPTGGATIGEEFQRFSGVLVYPSTAQPTGFITVANLRAGARYFEAMALQSLTDVDIKTGVETVATFIVAGYGVTLTSGFASKVDVVTP